MIERVEMPMSEAEEAVKRDLLDRIHEIRLQCEKQIEPYMKRLMDLEARRPIALILPKTELSSYLREMLETGPE